MELLRFIDLHMATPKGLNSATRSDASGRWGGSEALVLSCWGIATLLAFGAIAIQIWKYLHLTNQRNDFTVFYRAGGELLRGDPIYNLDITILGWDFLYPPPALLFFLPLSMLPHGIAQWTFFFLGGSTCAAALAYVWRSVPSQSNNHTPRAAIAATTMVLAMDTVWNNAIGGQMSFVLTAICVAFLAALRARRHAVAGLMAAIGTFLKIYPAIMLAASLFRRDWWTTIVWAAVAVAIAVAATLVAAPASLFLDYFLGVIPKLAAQSTGWYANQGVSGMVFRWGLARDEWFVFTRSTMPTGLRQSLSIGTVIMGLILGGMIARATPMTSLAAGCALIALPGITSPNALIYVFVASVPVLLLALKLAWESRQLHPWSSGLLPMLLVPLYLPAYSKIPFGHLLPVTIENIAYTRYSILTVVVSGMALYLAAQWDRRSHSTDEQFGTPRRTTGSTQG